MKIISKRVGHFSNIERYDLKDIFSQTQTACGLVICYAVTICKNSKLVSLDLKAEQKEIGVVENWHGKFSYESFIDNFHNLKEFLGVFDTDDFGRWTAKIIYQNVEVSIIGERNITEITVSYPKEKNLNILPLLNEIELSTFKFNNYDTKILNILKNEYNMSEKRAVLTIQKLIAYKDIYDEFATAIISGEYMKPSSAIAIEGYTAESLVSNYPLSLIGAYNYLIYLRESPKEALEDLRKGLPRK